MKLKVERKWKKASYTVGKLYVNGQFFCNTMEDTDRGLKQTHSLSTIKDLKVPNETAIPTGTYNVRMDIMSPKYSVVPWYLSNCHGARLPRLENVPGFSGILIHPGNTAADSSGCLLVGKNDVVGKVTKSKDYFLKLYNTMYAAYKRGEKIEIEIT